MSPSSDHSPAATRGVFAALGCFLIWGLFPLYWKRMAGVAAIELIAHRVVWSLLFLAVVMAFRREGFAPLRAALRSRRTVALTLLSGALLATNWLIYVWAVNHDQVIESSLGYFLVPLVNVAMGCLILHERPRPLQWLAIAAAAAGVGVLLLRLGHVPWVALGLAGSWGCYSLMRKRSALGALDGLGAETLLYAAPAAAFLLWRHHTGEGALGRVDPVTHGFLLSAGWVTAIPLILFVYGAQRIRLTTVGLLQYIAPTVQFLVGLLVYREPFDAARLNAYACIWAGLALYAADSFWAQRRLLQAALVREPVTGPDRP